MPLSPFIEPMLEKYYITSHSKLSVRTALETGIRQTYLFIFSLLSPSEDFTKACECVPAHLP